MVKRGGNINAANLVYSNILGVFPSPENAGVHKLVSDLTKIEDQSRGLS